MSKILVTGANGFVGQHVVRELKAHSYEVIAVGGRGLPSTQPNEDSNLALDLTQPAEANKIDFTDVAAVIHLAGLAAVGPSFDDPMRYINTNIGIETNLFEAALAQQVTPRFLIISTGSLYDAASDLPLTEASPVQAGSPYAVSKLGQEEMARYYSGRGFEIMVARPFNHIGPGQELGFLVPDVTKQVIDYEKSGTGRVLVGNLDAQRDYTDVRDIARAYRLLLEKGVPGETYNVCSGQARSGQAIVDAILALTDAKPAVESDPARMRPSDNPVIYGSNQKISDATGWQPEISIEQTLADVVSDWRSR
jgi:GDP-4-dehydro-6-deoxy-D-mannose reductase